ncbi:hypothetical protein H5410_060463 [Solanum commersonii]|uniref:DUF7746 domain-containing protein n=1 Tax=Solanum commersonii TaxID=4109 RepID=A0A9J5W5H7_SOLCO|nr:hypothetical protein H5410_060463 [Solanum commersonii]
MRNPLQVPSRASTSQIRENYRCDNIKIDRDNISRPMPRPSSDLDIIEYNTNWKANKNSDNTIADMITTGFTSQLKG